MFKVLQKKHSESEASRAEPGVPRVGGNGGQPGAADLAIPSWLSFALGLVGFGVSLYALILHLKSKGLAGAPLSCDVNDLVSCTKVLGSEYGEFLSLPLGALGMSYFGMVMGVAMLPKLTEVSKRWAAHWQLIVAAIGAAVSLVLAYVSYFTLNAVCLVCSAIHILTLVNFAVALVQFFKNKSGPQFAHPSAFVKLLSVTLALGVPPLVAGVILPTLAPLIFSKTDSAKVTSGASPDSGSADAAMTATPYPAELVAFSKSNFVGKGEDYRKGNDNAKVVLHMFSDFECPHCQRASEIIDQALSMVGTDKVLFVYRNYPLSNHCNPNISGEGHKYACELAIASRCAGQQGRFWPYKEWAFTHMEKSEAEKAKLLSNDGLTAQAGKMGLDATRFSQCLTSKVELPKIQDDIVIGQKLGLEGTPLIIINGRRYSGQHTPEAFAAAMQQALLK